MKQIPLSHGKIAIVDDDDYDMLMQYNWHASFNWFSWYAECNRGSKHLKMHRLILNAPQDKLVDHINHNTLDNRKSNLRLCTKSENARNIQKSKHKGVSWHRQSKKWRSTIKVNGKQISLGLFDTPDDAARAYNKAAAELFGEFANLNQLP